MKKHISKNVRVKWKLQYISILEAKTDEFYTASMRAALILTYLLSLGRGFRAAITLAVRNLLVFASSIEIYYFIKNAYKT